jgi:hypothetical protein
MTNLWVPIGGFIIGAVFVFLYMAVNFNLDLKPMIVIMLAAGVIFSVVAMVVAENSPVLENKEFITDTPIYSIHMGDKISGTFFLGSGSVNSYTQYLFYKDSGTGGYVLDKVFTDGTVIFQDENNQPYLRRIETAQVDIKSGEHFGAYSYRYEIHVPKGTIVEEYKL